MSNFTRSLITLAAALCLTGTLTAATLATAPAHADFGGDVLYCDIVYIGKSSGNVTIEAKDYSGAVLTALSTTLTPDHAVSLLGNANSAYCVFTVSGKAKSYRAAAIYYNNGAYTMAMDAK